jgi:hypothetical protein
MVPVIVNKLLVLPFAKCWITNPVKWVNLGNLIIENYFLKERTKAQE